MKEQNIENFLTRNVGVLKSAAKIKKMERDSMKVKI